MDIISFLHVSLGSKTVQLHDNLGSRHAYKCFNSQNGDRAWVCTTEEQSSVVCFCGLKDSTQRIFIKKCFLFMAESVCPVKRFTTGLRNSLKDVWKSHDAWPGCPVEIATNASVQQVEELIQTERRIMIDSVASALGFAHGLAYSIAHARLKFQKEWTENWGVKKKLPKWVCPCNISYGMQMKEKICLTGLLVGTNRGCITTNPNWSMLQFNGNMPVHFPPESLRLCHLIWEGYAYHIFGFSESTVSPFSECDENEFCIILRSPVEASGCSL
jgi:hypothetical protein